MTYIIIIIDIRWRYFRKSKADASPPDDDASTTPESSLTPRCLTAELRDASQEYMRYDDDIQPPVEIPAPAEIPAPVEIRPSEILASQPPVEITGPIKTYVVNQNPVDPRHVDRTPAERAERELDAEIAPP